MGHPLYRVTSFEHLGAHLLRVVFDDGSIQAWADETYGEGLVKVTSALQPVEG